MAGQLIRECIDNTRSKPTARLVLLVLAERANGDRYCWPSIARLAKDTGLTERSVRTSLNELRSLGEIHSQYISNFRPQDYLVRSHVYLLTVNLTEDQITQRLMAYPFYRQSKEAASIAQSLVTLQGQPKPQKQAKTKPHDRNVVPGNLVPGNLVPFDTGTTFPPIPERRSPKPLLEPSLEPEDSIATFVPQVAIANSTSNGAKNGNGHSKAKAKKTTPVPPPPPLPHIAIIDAWHAALPDDVRPAGKPVYSKNVRPAKDLQDAGITPDDVTRFVTETYAKYRAWAKREDAPQLMALAHVKTYIRAWLSKAQPETVPLSERPAEFWDEQPNRKWDF